MQQLKPLNSREIRNVMAIIKKQWGAEPKLDLVFLMNNRNKLYIVQKDAFDIDLEKLRIDSIGLYFGELIGRELRLSIEGSQLVGPHAKKNIVELDEKESREWLHGYDVDINDSYDGFVLVKSKKDFLGCGKFSNGKVLNYVPKARRLRSSD